MDTRYRFVILLAVILVVGSVVFFLLRSDTEPDNPAPTQTVAQVDASAQSEETSEAPSLDITHTPESPEYDFILNFFSEYTTTEDFNGIEGVVALPPDGHRYYVVTGTMFNMAGYPITITAESIVAIDQDGQIYTADVPDELIDEPLVGNTLDQSEAVFGSAGFTIPIEAKIETIYWCADEIVDPCAKPIYTEF